MLEPCAGGELRPVHLRCHFKSEVTWGVGLNTGPEGKKSKRTYRFVNIALLFQFPVFHQSIGTACSVTALATGANHTQGQHGHDRPDDLLHNEMSNDIFFSFFAFSHIYQTGQVKSELKRGLEKEGMTGATGGNQTQGPLQRRPSASAVRCKWKTESEVLLITTAGLNIHLKSQTWCLRHLFVNAQRFSNQERRRRGWWC